MLPLQLQAESHIPLYVQLCDQLRALVHAGDLRPGDRIPASRELARHLGVHRTTVANAYAELESEGLIEGHVGRGTFIRANWKPLQIAPAPPSLVPGGAIRWESLFADERGDDALDRLIRTTPASGISFVVARPPEEYFPLAAMRHCCNAVLRREGARILQYGATDGYPPLRKALLELLRSEGVQAREENLLISDGCQQALDLICKVFLRPGDTVVLENPTYPGNIAVLAAARARCLGVPVRTENGPGATPGLDLAALEQTLAANRVKMMMLMPDFHNPTGLSMTLEARRRLLEIASKHQVPIVEDHIYARLLARGDRLPSLKQLDRANVVVQTDSFSKVAFPGLRVGWIVAPANVIDRLRVVKQSTDLHTDQLSQAVMAEFTRRGLLLRQVALVRKLCASRLAAVEEALVRHMPSETRWTHPNGGMSIWLELPPGFDANELLVRARERGVVFAPGRYFYVQSPQPNTLRLGFAELEERQIARGVAILGDILRAELGKRQRGARRFEPARVALV
jgi:DNA-binding transcriptional MocR family regulator